MCCRSSQKIRGSRTPPDSSANDWGMEAHRRLGPRPNSYSTNSMFEFGLKGGEGQGGLYSSSSWAPVPPCGLRKERCHRACDLPSLWPSLGFGGVRTRLYRPVTGAQKPKARVGKRTYPVRCRRGGPEVGGGRGGSLQEHGGGEEEEVYRQDLGK